jgi:hypothetical protein
MKAFSPNLRKSGWPPQTFFSVRLLAFGPPIVSAAPQVCCPLLNSRSPSRPKPQTRPTRSTSRCGPVLARRPPSGLRRRLASPRLGVRAEHGKPAPYLTRVPRPCALAGSCILLPCAQPQPCRRLPASRRSRQRRRPHAGAAAALQDRACARHRSPIAGRPLIRSRQELLCTRVRRKKKTRRFPVRPLQDPIITRSKCVSCRSCK